MSFSTSRRGFILQRLLTPSILILLRLVLRTQRRSEALRLAPGDVEGSIQREFFRFYESAAREVWKALGVPDRMGATEERVGHCQWHPGFTPALEAYLDKFLLGKAGAPSTDILRSKFTDVDRGKWIPWSTPELK